MKPSAQAQSEEWQSISWFPWTTLTKYLSFQIIMLNSKESHRDEFQGPVDTIVPGKVRVSCVWTFSLFVHDNDS